MPSAADFAATLTAPVVFFTSLGAPTGVRVALLEDTELPFALDALEGEVRDGEWRWDGEGDLTDWRANTVRLVTVYEDEVEFSSQREDWETSA